MKKMIRLMVALAMMVAIPGLALAQGKIEKEILELVNQHRKKKGLAALEMNAAISAAAAKHSRNMATKKIRPGHDGFDERMDKLLKEIKGTNATAENVAYGARDAERVVEMWLDSKGHRKNIEGDYNLTGIAVERAKDGTLYFTQIFMRRK